MLENDFEKRMQEKMEELKFRPSEEIWPKVATELKRKKRRRVAILFFLPALLGLAGLSIYFLSRPGSSPLSVKPASAQNQVATHPSQSPSSLENIHGQHTDPSSHEPGITDTGTSQTIHKKIDNTAAVQTTENKNSSNQTQPVPGKDMPSGAQAAKEDSYPVISKKQPRTSASNRLRTNNAVGGKTGKEIGKVNGKRQGTVPGRGQDQSAKRSDNEAIRDKTVITPGDTATHKKDRGLAQNQIVNTTSPGIDSTVHEPTLAQLNPNDKDQKDSTQENTQSPAVANIKKSKTKWKVGFEFSAGVTSRRDDQFPILSGNSTRSLPLAYYQGGLGSAGIPPRIIQPPSSIKAGPAFKAGVFAQWQWSRKSSASAGLRYSWLTEQIKVGSYSDTVIVSNSYQFNMNNMVSGLYSSTRQKNYSNHYHFIEMPLLYHWQINKGKKIPVAWNIGITPSYLIATNSLIYDTTANGVYYRDKDAFNRFHISMQTGFSFRFGKPGRLQWSIGPEISFDMSRMLKQEMFTANKYILFGGISGRIHLPGKK